MLQILLNPVSHSRGHDTETGCRAWACYSETSVDFQHSSRRCVPEDRSLCFLICVSEYICTELAPRNGVRSGSVPATCSPAVNLQKLRLYTRPTSTFRIRPWIISPRPGMGRDGKEAESWKTAVKEMKQSKGGPFTRATRSSRSPSRDAVP
jgi:hypothetical protein